MFCTSCLGREAPVLMTLFADKATAGSETSGQPERREGLGTLIELSHRFIDLNGRLMGNSAWRRCNQSWLMHALNETDGKRNLLHLAARW